MGEPKYMVAVVGAGPAGLFGARELANQGAQVVLFNRDIKPGGLAEYGIFPNKYAMKEGLRRQFRQVLENPNIEYYGNVKIGEKSDLRIEDLRDLGFQAILVTAGAQGTKWLGIPGEDLNGVYHAKDLVYHYNKLPPYSQKFFQFGKRCAVVGAGNVMVDITHYLSRVIKVDEVIAVVRRGPAEVKFDKKEMEYVISYLDMAAFDAELARVAPVMQAVGQDPQAARENILAAMPKALPAESDTRFRFDFLSTTARIIGNENGQVTGLEVEENTLTLMENGDTNARSTKQKRTLEIDSIIFAIGDKVDANFGLPVSANAFVKSPEPRYPIDGLSYEAFDPDSNQPIDDVFVGGWSRQASHGLVGYARKDGTNASKAVWQYLQTLQPVQGNLDAIRDRLNGLDKPIITKQEINKLRTVEQEEAQKRGLEDFKFATNQEMLAAIGMEKTPITA
jgi:ferredoxin--NADP+ reductase